MLAGPDIFVTASTAIVSYLRELVSAKRAAPADDLLSTLVAVRDGEDRLSEDELTSMANLLLGVKLVNSWQRIVDSSFEPVMSSVVAVVRSPPRYQ